MKLIIEINKQTGEYAVGGENEYPMYTDDKDEVIEMVEDYLE